MLYDCTLMEKTKKKKAAIIYSYLIKYWAKQKHFLPYHDTRKLKILTLKCIIKVNSNDELKEIDIKNRTCFYSDDIIKIEDFDCD